MGSKQGISRRCSIQCGCDWRHGRSQRQRRFARFNYARLPGFLISVGRADSRLCLGDVVCAIDRLNSVNASGFCMAPLFANESAPLFEHIHTETSDILIGTLFSSETPQADNKDFDRRYDRRYSRFSGFSTKDK